MGNTPIISDKLLADEPTAERFKSAFRLHPAGVALVTANTQHGPVAMTVSSVASVNVSPPVLMFSAAAISSVTPALATAETVVVHMLGKAHLELAKLGATSGVNRFADLAMWRTLPNGNPEFIDAYAWLEGRIIQRIDVSGSVVMIIEIDQIRMNDQSATEPSAEPLVYFARGWHTLGDQSLL